MAREQASARVGSANSGRDRQLPWGRSRLLQAAAKKTGKDVRRQQAGHRQAAMFGKARHRRRPLVETMQAASTTSWLGTKKDPKANSRSPVVWLEEPNALGSSRVADGVSINGINVSDQRLEEVQGTLKPDGSGREFKLALEVEGAKAKEESVIPARARFGMRAKIPKAERSSGGAILTFRYRYAGQQKATILYLSPSMVARLADRGSSP